MNDLQKDQVIYQAMLEIANKVFSNAAEKNESLRNYISEKGGNVSLGDILKRSSDVYFLLSKETPYDKYTKEGYQTVTVDTFSCQFPQIFVFGYLNDWKSLAKVKGDIFFSYEEKIENERAGSVEITFDDPTSAKTLANYLTKDEYQPLLDHVLLEVNATTGNINFVACDGKVLGVICNAPQHMRDIPNENDKVFEALFPAAKWKQICDYAKKSKSAVKFEIFKRKSDEKQDTMVANLGDAKIKSTILERPYPNWRKVLPKNADKHFAIHPDDVKAARNFIKSFKFADKYEKDRQQLCVSFYRGSDIGYFDFYDLDFDIAKTATFRLTKPSEITVGTCYNISQLQKIKFTGFGIGEPLRATEIDCEDTDYMILMPCVAESYVFHVEEREVIVSELCEVA